MDKPRTIAAKVRQEYRMAAQDLPA